MPETIKLVRLRGSLKFYEHLKDYLEFLHHFGYASFQDSNEDWLNLKQRLNEQGADGFDLGDIRSALRMLNIVENGELTLFGTDLYNHREDEDYLKKEIGQLMLIDKKGWAYCEILKKLPYGNREKIGELYEEVYDRGGFQDEYTDISKYNIFLNWLGVSRKGNGNKYKLIETKYNEYLGIVTNDIERFDRDLKLEEKYCLIALIKLNSLGRRPYKVKEIREFVSQFYNYKLNIHNQNGYGRKLQEKGYIQYDYSSHNQASTHQRGQQGMWTLVESDSFNDIILKILEDTIKLDINWSLIDIIESDFDTIAEKINSSSDHERGIGLEQFASKICWTLGLKNIKLNYMERGLELDVIANQEHPFFTKFLIQCKNTSSTTSPAILYKEVGVASTKKFNNIMIFTTSGFSSNMREVADNVMKKTGINVFLFDNDDVSDIINNPKSLMKIIERENVHIKEIRDSD